jgi:hypothetical protein
MEEPIPILIAIQAPVLSNLRVNGACEGKLLLSHLRHHHAADQVSGDHKEDINADESAP